MVHCSLSYCPCHYHSKDRSICATRLSAVFHLPIFSRHSYYQCSRTASFVFLRLGSGSQRNIPNTYPAFSVHVVSLEHASILLLKAALHSNRSCFLLETQSSNPHLALLSCSFPPSPSLNHPEVQSHASHSTITSTNLIDPPVLNFYPTSKPLHPINWLFIQFNPLFSRQNNPFNSHKFLLTLSSFLTLVIRGKR